MKQRRNASPEEWTALIAKAPPGARVALGNGATITLPDGTMLDPPLGFHATDEIVRKESPVGTADAAARQN